MWWKQTLFNASSASHARAHPRSIRSSVCGVRVEFKAEALGGLGAGAGEFDLGDVGKDARIKDLVEAFNVDKLNKEFFTDYRNTFQRVAADIRQRNPHTDAALAEREAQTLLNRLLFLCFVQRKGWLNRQRDYLFRNFRQHAERRPDGTTFHQQFLKPLFIKLATEGGEADIPGHDLPFLNGGLFADEYGAEQRGEAARRSYSLKIGNDVFQHVFADLLEAYNFTVREDSPLSVEVAIDPEMLGKVFESLVLQLEQSDTGGKTSRHDTGSFYTPRPIVHYLCREGLRGWLEQFPPDLSTATDWPQQLEKLLALDASDGIDPAERATLDACLTPEEARAILDRLDEVRACDLAVGSGAFPVGLLHELLNLRRLCETRSRGKDPVEADSHWLYETKARIIERCLYGVDIQERAIEICKLRLWLSLMVDHPLEADVDSCSAKAFRDALRRITPLPNLDFKIRRANSLVDYIHGEPVELGQLSRETGAAMPLSKLTSAKREFFNARTAAAKRRLRLDIYEALAARGQLGEAFGGGAAGFAGAEQVGVAAGGGLVAHEVAFGVEGGFARGESETVVGPCGEEDGKHPVVFGLVNEPGDQVAQADPVAGKVGVFADPHFEDAELAVALELDAAELENRFGAIIRAGQRLGQGKNLRLGQDTAQRLQPTVALVRSGKE
jgi:hypothetical protein